MIEIDTEMEPDEADIQKLKNFTRNLVKAKKEKQEREFVPFDKRVYITAMFKDGAIISTGASRLAYQVKGKKEAEYLCRQLERRFNRKFYLEEVTSTINQ